ncbi:hypothetical protein PHYSODRAFT_533743, partial [Phytophthora sojae]
PMLTAVELVLRQHPSFRSQTSVGSKVSTFVGPSPTLSLHQACAMGSLKLLDLLWEASCTSMDTRSVGWSLSNFLRSEPHYYHWEFIVSLLVAANRGNLEVVQWLFDHFSGCEAPADAFEEAAVNDHLPVVKFLLANSDNCRDENVVHWSDYVVTEAATKGHLELVRWLYDNVAHKISQDCTDRVIEQALRFGSIELAEEMTPPGQNILEYATEHAAPQVVEMMLDGGFLETNGRLAAETTSRIADKGHFALLERLLTLCSSPTEYMDRWCFAFGNALSKACELGELPAASAGASSE